MSIRQGRQCLTTLGGGSSNSSSSSRSSTSSSSSSSSSSNNSNSNSSSSSSSSSSKGLELVCNASINEKVPSRNLKRGGLGRFGLWCYKKNAERTMVLRSHVPMHMKDFFFFFFFNRHCNPCGFWPA